MESACAVTPYRGFESHPLRLVTLRATDRGAVNDTNARQPLDGPPAGVAPSAFGRAAAQSTMLQSVDQDADDGESPPPASWDGAGPCAVQTREPRQARKGAALSEALQVPQDHPAFVSLLA